MVGELRHGEVEEVEDAVGLQAPAQEELALGRGRAEELPRGLEVAKKRVHPLEERPPVAPEARIDGAVLLGHLLRLGLG